jgi:uncharacterized membrane-anchored protein
MARSTEDIRPDLAPAIGWTVAGLIIAIICLLALTTVTASSSASVIGFVLTILALAIGVFAYYVGKTVVYVLEYKEALKRPVEK